MGLVIFSKFITKEIMNGKTPKFFGNYDSGMYILTYNPFRVGFSQRFLYL